MDILDFIGLLQGLEAPSSSVPCTPNLDLLHFLPLAKGFRRSLFSPESPARAEGPVLKKIREEEWGGAQELQNSGLGLSSLNWKELGMLLRVCPLSSLQPEAGASLQV